MIIWEKWQERKWRCRGQIPVIGSEQGGTRPVLIISNNTGNRFSPTVIIAAITSRPKKGKLPTHFCLDGIAGLPADSIILFEQIRTIDKKRLKERMTQLDERSMEEITAPLLISIGVKNMHKSDRRADNV